MILAAVIPVLQSWNESESYKLSAASMSLVGHTDASLAKKLSYDSSKNLYQFNKDAVVTGVNASLPSQVQKASVGAKDKSNAKTYALDVPEDFSKGVTYHDTNSQLSFSLVPEFAARGAKTEQGHIVFPLGGGNQAVYTLKNNGLKEDILVARAAQDTMRFSYQLNLPKTLEARVIPGSGGAVGIYAADPSLFGEITYGSDKDKVRVELAREKGNKTSLVFGLPAPVIRAAGGKNIGNASARFVLQGNRLSVVAEHIFDAKNVPLTIDPSVVVTSTTDFQYGGNNEGMIDFGTSGQINRGGLTGGDIGSWASTSALSTNLERTGSTFYNGYFYVLGGNQRGVTSYNTARYVAVNSDGTLGTWRTTTALPYNNYDFKPVAYNGYMYMIGGTAGASSGPASSSSYYSKINSDGTLGTWVATTSLPTTLAAYGAATYNGYLYVMGGATDAAWTPVNFIQTTYYAPLNADGTLGSWSTTTNLSTKRSNLTANTYNGYLYVFGGQNTTPSFLATVEYAIINSDGTIGSWMTTNSFSGGRYGQITDIYNGYAYTVSGWGTSYFSDAQYAPVNANGSLGAWVTSSITMGTGVKYVAGGLYNGYAYIGTGYDGTTDYSTMYYSQLRPAGYFGNYAAGTVSTSSRIALRSVAYNGYLYTLGGVDIGGTSTNEVGYAPINTNGSIGSWALTTAFTTNRGFFYADAYNGFMYVCGGATTGQSTTINTCYYAAIASNGTVGAWTATANFITARMWFAGAIYNGNMYIGGGNDTGGGTQFNDIQYAPINSNGTLGAWHYTHNSTDDSTTFVAGFTNVRESLSMVAYGGNLYIIGGWNSAAGGTYYNDVQYAPINTNGTVGTWATTSSFTTAREDLSVVAANGYLYLAGGQNGTGVLSDVQYAPINANGTVGTWASTTSVPANNDFSQIGRSNFGMAAYNGYIYIVGGRDNALHDTNDVRYVPINNGGPGITGSYTATNSFTTGRYGHATVVYNGYMYIMGGYSPTYLNDVQYAPINADGTVGTWAATTSFTTARQYLTATAYNGYLYVLGGWNGTTYYNNVQYAPINTNGTIGTWTATTSFATARRGHTTAINNGFIYIVGGYSGSLLNDVQYAPINADGTVGTWAATTSFTTARNSHATIVNNGYMYVIGGWPGAYTNNVQFAPINSNGTLGTWVTTSALPTLLANEGAAVYDGFVYLTGGTNDGSTILSTVYYAPLNANGTIGTWTTTTSLASVRYIHNTVAYNGYLYTTGGFNGSYFTEVTSAPLNSIARTGRYSKVVDLGGPQNISSFTYNGALSNGLSAISYRSADATGVFSTTAKSAATILNPSACLTDLTNTRYVLVTIVLDAAASGAFAENSTTPANVTDFTVNYVQPHPRPNIHLRMGQTLQSGVLSPLDICAP